MMKHISNEMMKFRWTVAGGDDFPFEQDAVAEIHRITKGNPRAIVKLANETLIKTAVDQAQQIACPLFQAAWAKAGTKSHLWKKNSGTLWHYPFSKYGNAPPRLFSRLSR